MRGYPKWFPRILFLVIAVAALAGIALIPNFLFYKMEWFEDQPMDGKMRMNIASIHVTAAVCLTFLFGAVWTIHMRHGWRMKLHRVSGTLFVAAFALLALSGIGSWYFSNETLIRWNGILHVASGISLILMAVVHPVLGWLHKRRIARERA